MDALLKLLHENGALKPAQLASMLNVKEAEIAARIKAYEADQVILGYRAVLNEEKLDRDIVRAVIEVKITPERGGGFDRLAERIAKYNEVQSCYLMSGGYDLLVVVEGGGHDQKFLRMTWMVLNSGLPGLDVEAPTPVRGGARKCCTPARCDYTFAI